MKKLKKLGNKFNLLNEEVEEIGQQNKSLDSKNRGLEQEVEIL